MITKEHLICPKCQGIYFELKKEATYLYTYKLDTPLTSDWNNKDESLPFLFDNREKLNSSEYIECKDCGQQYSHDLNNNMIKGELTILKKAVRANYVDKPEFLG